MFTWPLQSAASCYRSTSSFQLIVPAFLNIFGAVLLEWNVFAVTTIKSNEAIMRKSEQLKLPEPFHLNELQKIPASNKMMIVNGI